MLNVFTLVNGRLVQEEIDSERALAALRPIWVDLEAPTEEEKRWIATRFGLSLPEDIVDDDLEESARFYEGDNGELHIRSDFLIDDESVSRNVRVAFILKDGVLHSVHAEDLPVFRLLRMRARRIPALIEDAKDVLLKLFDADAEYSADALEGVYDPQDRGLRLLGVLAWSTRQLLRYEAAIRSGLAPPEAAQRAGAPPFTARELGDQLRRISRSELEGWLDVLAGVDVALKGGSKRPPKAVLEHTIIALCAGPKARDKGPSGRSSRPPA